jgi:hypothetical protein
MLQIGFKPFMAGEWVLAVIPSRQKAPGKTGLTGINHRSNRCHDVNDNLPALRQEPSGLNVVASLRDKRTCRADGTELAGMGHEFRDDA